MCKQIFIGDSYFKSEKLTKPIHLILVSGEPREVAAITTSPTEVRLTWVAPFASQQNGDLLGYKIFYLATSQTIDKEEMEVVPASHVAHSLPFMDMFTEYRIQIVAFNPAGDGPRSVPVTVRTLQGIPGSPGSLK